MSASKFVMTAGCVASAAVAVYVGMSRGSIDLGDLGATLGLSAENVGKPAAARGLSHDPFWGDMSTEFELCRFGSACEDELVASGDNAEEPIWEDAEVDRIRKGTEQQRVGLNRNQPSQVPKFTDVGYKHVKVPEDVYNAILEDWLPRKYTGQVENWPIDATYVNHWEVPSTMVGPSGHIYEVMKNGLQPIMEEWSKVSLEHTATYGVRTYHRGARLANHVDKVATHVISGIINVAQDLDEPWPLYVKGHDGIARAIYMEPGDLVLYESASVIHGRPSKMAGESFTNIFIHFQPANGWRMSDDGHFTYDAAAA